MATFNTEGLEELAYAFLRQEQGATEAINAMLDAQTEIYVEEQQKAARQYGIYKTGGFVASLKAGKTKTAGTEIYREIVPEGRAEHKADYGGGSSKRKGKAQQGNVRYATIGYIFEYGTSSMAARPWLTKGNNAASEKAYNKAYEIWSKYVDDSFS